MNITSIAAVNCMNNKRSSQGRRKIEIKKIVGPNNRQVTFSKRRHGLFKKAAELCILTGAHIVILVHSPGGRVFAFGHPTVDGLVDDLLNTASTPDGSTSSTTHKRQPDNKEFSQHNQHYVEISRELEAEKKQRQVIQESKIISGSDVPWYKDDVDGLEVEELEQYLSSLVELKKKVLVRVEDLKMIMKAPAILGPLNISQVNDNIPNMENLMNGATSSSFDFAANSSRREWMM